MEKIIPVQARSFARYAWAVLACNVLVILWGAYVRASGSGAGCGNHWPLCNGEVLPASPTVKTFVELAHRLTSGVALLLVVGLAVWAFRKFPRRHPVRRGAALSVLFILTEALVGAGLVLFELVADNASVARALFMSVHLANTFILLGVLTLTAWWASGGQPLSLRGQGVYGGLFALALLGTIVLGVSGAVAALGDTLFPALTLAEALRQDFSPTAHLLIRLRLAHPLIAVVVGCYVVIISVVASLLRPHVWTRRFTLALVALVVAQLGLGLLNVALLAPIWLQLVHLLLADAVWIVLVLNASTVLERDAPAQEFAARLKRVQSVEA
ncbi:MAG TPA: COX15/CtaA family protein [Pyrinomonadaceae bacterium]|nr:COX15/CtaA family protein [Pyrinomonadaceae bacterium]